MTSDLPDGPRTPPHRGDFTASRSIGVWLGGPRTWRVFRTNANARQASEQEEKFADKFASCLLIPEDALRDAIGAAWKSRGTLKHIELFDIARQFDVSIDALLWRMQWVFGRDIEETQRDLETCRAFRETVDVREDTRPPALPER